MNSLFDEGVHWQPLAARMRPTTLDQYVGQEHLFGHDKPLRRALEGGNIHSMILWGPPGVGKTTLAMLLANYVDAQFHSLSAVLSGVKEIRAAIDQAKQQQRHQRKTLLFVDEVHRFNKSQQDAFLPHIEDGTFIFVGATTENPSFELNSALLSRTRVYVLKPIVQQALEKLLVRAISDETVGVGSFGVLVEQPVITRIAEQADGDARRALSLLEIAIDFAQSIGSKVVTDALLKQAVASDIRAFDKGGDIFYDQISALHKAVRGSSPDGALYWYIRMLDGGCDPLYIARRVVRMASEDIGNADPRALQIALNAWDAQARLGHPEGELAIAQALVYLAAAPKSNAVYSAFNQIRKQVQSEPSYAVPVHLRNAPTALMKQQGHGVGYRYAHDYSEAYAAGESYLPAELSDKQWYQPTQRGLEIKISEKLEYLKQLDQESAWKRHNS